MSFWALRRGVLDVEVDASAWAQQLQLRRPELLAALRARSGEAAPRDLRLRVGRRGEPADPDGR